MILWIWAVLLVVALVLYIRKKYSRFTSHGVKTLKIVPLLGTSYRSILMKEHLTKDIERNYRDLPNERFVGKYDFLAASILVRDLELIKKITVKDFEYFIDHHIVVDENSDPLLGRTLLSLKGEEWKDMRGTLSPAFTSSKIRLMVPFMVEVGNQMIKSLKMKIEEGNDGYVDIEIKDLVTRYTNDVIASCAFGLKVDSHFDVNNEFFVKGQYFSTFKLKQMLILFGTFLFPKLMKRLDIAVFPKSVTGFFRRIILDTMKHREENNIVRPDMIHLLMEAKKGQLSHEDKADTADAGFSIVKESELGNKTVNRVWTDTDIVAQAIIFFAAGFDTVGTSMSFLLYELAVNPDVQERLFKEIQENDEKNNGKFDYNSIQQMTYLDMVVSEALRLWPPAPIIDRECNKDYNLGRPNSEETKDFIVKSGEYLIVPVWAIHRDPKYFPDPLKFVPERFSEDNKHKIKPFTYMPFGLGPRNCIGSRFALCEVKVMVYQLLKYMELSPGAKTQIPLKLSMEFNLMVEGGNWLRIKNRT